MSPFYSSWFTVTAISVCVLLVLSGWGFAFLQAVPRLRIASIAVSRRSEEFIYGVLAFSVLGFLGVLLGASLDLTFAGGSALAAAVCGLWLKRRRRAHPTLVDASPDAVNAKRALNWLAPIIVVAGSLIWSISNFRGLEQTGSSVELVPWVDFFFHARQISNFGRFEGEAGALHWSMYGETLVPYHYASYMVSALASRLGHIHSLQVATSLYPVLGMVLTGAAMLVLAEATGGAGVALIALGVLFFVPDISCWIPGFTRQSSYFFFQEVGVGGAYAIGICGLALASALRARATGGIGQSAWAGALLLSAALFKIQIVLAYGIFFFLLILFLSPRLGPRLKAALAFALLASFALLVWKASEVPNAPTIGLSLDSVRRLFGLAAGTFQSVLAVALLPVAALALWGSTYGILLPVAAFLGWHLRRDPGARGAIFLICFFMLAHAYVRLLIKDNQGFGDAGEINRKTFVLPYFVLAYGTAILVWRGLEGRTLGAVRRLAKSRWLAPALVSVVVGSTVVAAHRLQLWPGTSELYTRRPVPAGLIETTLFLRVSAPLTDVVQLCENDVYNQLATLSERPVYVAKLMVNAPPVSETERQRFAMLKGIREQADFVTAAQMATNLRINWWVVTPTCETRWEGGQRPAFASGGYRLYHF